MSDAVSDMAVVLSGKVQTFEGAMQQAQASLRHVQNAVNTLSSGQMKELHNQLNVTAPTAAAQASTGYAGLTTSLVGLAAAYGAVQKLTGAVTLGAQLAGEAQRADLAFETMLGSAAKAKAFHDQLRKLVLSNPLLDMQATRQTAARMLTQGFAEGDIPKIIATISDAAATSMNNPAAAIDTITTALGRMQATGRVTSRELRMLQDEGLRPWEALAQAVGKTQDELRDLVEKGAIPANTAIRAILENIERTRGGAAQRSGQTIGGMFSQISTDAQTILEETTRRVVEFTDERPLLWFLSLKNFQRGVQAIRESVTGISGDSDAAAKRAADLQLAGPKETAFAEPLRKLRAELTELANTYHLAAEAKAHFLAEQQGATAAELAEREQLAGQARVLQALAAAHAELRKARDATGATSPQEQALQDAQRAGATPQQLQQLQQLQETRAEYQRIIDAQREYDRLIADANAKLTDPAAAILERLKVLGEAKVETLQQLQAQAKAADVAKSVEDVAQRLREQIATWGKAGEAAEVYRLRAAGATTNQIAAVQALIGQLDQLRAVEEGKALAERFASPFEQMTAEIQKLDALKERGAITDTVYRRGILQAMQQAEQALKTTEARSPAALQRGGREAYSAWAERHNANPEAANAMQKIRDLMAEDQAVQAAQLQAAKDIAEALKNSQVLKAAR